MRRVGDAQRDSGHLYTDQWRSVVRQGVRSSANVLVPLIVERFSPRSVIDVGCGEGWFRDAFRDVGVTAIGVDGPWTSGPDRHVDLSSPPYPDLGRFDVAVCLEVAEHVPHARADALVAWLVSLAPVVVFSAAIPGQGGEGHVNEQWPTYWVERFSVHGFAGSGALRWATWDNDAVCWWYRQNLLVFGSSSSVQPDGCVAVVHPGMWKHHRR
jgi:SAM-dependent methyltransferase